MASGAPHEFNDEDFAEFLASGGGAPGELAADAELEPLEDAPVDAKPKGFVSLEQIDRAIAAKRAGGTRTPTTATTSRSAAGVHAPRAPVSYGQGPRVATGGSSGSTPSSGHGFRPSTGGSSVSTPSSSSGGSKTPLHPYVPPRSGHGGGGSGVKVSTPPPPTEAPTIGGKPLFSSLRENAPLADMIAEVERTVLSSARPVTWDDVVGLEGAKRSLEETMVLPLVALVSSGVSHLWHCCWRQQLPPRALCMTDSLPVPPLPAVHGHAALRSGRHSAVRAPWDGCAESQCGGGCLQWELTLAPAPSPLPCRQDAGCQGGRLPGVCTRPL